MTEELRLNPITGKFDLVEVSEDLHIDQTVPQNVVNGIPQFDEGIKIKINKRISLDGE